MNNMKHLPQIVCDVIKHKQQRYNTAGDYLKIGKRWNLCVSRLEKPEYELAVLIHELYEFFTTDRDGIKEKDITKFDIESGHKDPGTLKGAPYHKQHMDATKIERLVIRLLGEDWEEYDKSFEKLKY